MTTITHHSLAVGDLLLPQVKDVTGDGFIMTLLAGGHSKGTPEAILSTVAGLLADGDHVTYDRDGNREVKVPILIEAADHHSLSLGEKALRAEIRKPNLIVWTPPDPLGAAAPTCFVVITSWMNPVDDDEALLRCEQEWEVVFVCRPHARSLNPVVHPALPMPAGAPNPQVVDACTAVSGAGFTWTGTRSGVAHPVGVADSGTSVGTLDLDSVDTSPELWTLTRTGVIDCTLTPYLRVQARTVSLNRNEVTARALVAGQWVELPLVSSRVMDGGYYEITYDVGPVVVGAFTLVHTSASGEIWGGLLCRHVDRTDAPPNSGTGRQVIRTVEVGGTESGPGTVHVWSPDTTDLGQTIVATWPDKGDGFSPDLRRWQVSHVNEEIEASAISGKKEAIGPLGRTFYVPVSSISPGTYALVARMWSITAGVKNIYWEARTSVGGVGLEGSVSDSLDVSFPSVLAWQIVPLGVMSLPVVKATNGDLLFGLNHAGSADVEYDELWLIPVDEGCAVTIVTDVGATHLFCDAPGVDSLVPETWIANTADRSNARDPGTALMSEGAHEFTPGRMALLTITGGVAWPQSELTGFNWWHSTAAD